ncbi:MAG: Gldg family protein [Methylovulum sp.]|nr:Gldg family protein [Methylovulum sp.]
MLLNRKTLSASLLSVLAVLFVALVLLGNTLLGGVRLDLTENSLYTLSQGTRNLIGKLDEPIHLSLYFSDKATAESNRSDVRSLRLYRDRVQELLQEIKSLGGDKIRLHLIDPQPYSEAEDRAAASGIQGIPVGAAGEKLFFGLVGSNATDGQAVIPFFDQSKEAFLEYDLAKLIHDLVTVKKPVIGLVSGLPLAGGMDPQAGQMTQPWAVYQQLSQLFDVKMLEPNGLNNLDDNIKVLALVHPKKMSEDSQYIIDQFLMAGGHVLVFVDPNAELDMGGTDPNNPMAALTADKSSDLPSLFKAWGITYSPAQAVLDKTHALTVNAPNGRPMRHPAILRFGREDVDQGDVITANVDTLHVASAGVFQLSKDSPYQLAPLVRTSNQAMLTEAGRLRFLGDPATLLTDYKASGERYAVAARLHGKFKTAFPSRNDKGHLAEAKQAGDILLVADTDILSDRLWVQVQNFFGQQILNTFADNGDFFINAIDNLSGSSDLLAIRGRGTSSRPFTKVLALKQSADDSFRRKEQELQQQLSETEQKLVALQSAKTKDDKFVLSPEQQKELEGFLNRKLQIRKDLRDVRHQLDADIDALGAWLKFINIGLMPLLMTLATLGFMAWQAKRKPV